MYVKRKSLNHLLKYKNIHMSPTELNLENIKFNRYFNAPSIMKPRGFWYSLGTEWLDWIRLEFPSREYQYLYELDIDKSKLIIIKNADDLINFIETYNYNSMREKIAWGLVANDYCGIEFVNYDKLRSMRESYWYTTVDVSSGCIWNKNCIKSLNLISESPRIFK